MKGARSRICAPVDTRFKFKISQTSRILALEIQKLILHKFG